MSDFNHSESERDINMTEADMKVRAAGEYIPYWILSYNGWICVSKLKALFEHTICSIWLYNIK